jgi:alpha-L-fucosidase
MAMRVIGCFLLLGVICLAGFSAVSARAGDAVDPAAPAEAVARWRELRFGMFVHWGPVSLRGTEIGWSRGQQVPIEEYDGLYKRFDPLKFNADQWAAVAKDAGMKYLVFTTKHHDGFCMFDTKQTDYNIMNLLLNVGPMPDGRIEPRQVERLKEIGQWLAKYGESICGTRGGPFARGPWGASIHRGNKVYLHLLDPNMDVVKLPPLDRKTVDIRQIPKHFPSRV